MIDGAASLQKGMASSGNSLSAALATCGLNSPAVLSSPPSGAPPPARRGQALSTR